MEQKTYRFSGTLKDKTAIQPFYEALLPFLREHGLTASAVLPCLRPNTLEGEREKTQIIGSKNNGAIEYSVIEDPGCGYDTPVVGESLSGRNLAHFTSGELFSFFIQILNYDYPPHHLSLNCTGSDQATQAFQNLLAPLIAAYVVPEDVVPEEK